MAFGPNYVLSERQILVLEAGMQVFVALSIYYFLTASGNFQNLIRGIHICNMLAILRSLRLIIII